MVKYPRYLYGAKGFEDIADCVLVKDAAEEKIVRDAGYHDLGNPEDVAQVAEAKAPIKLKK